MSKLAGLLIIPVATIAEVTGVFLWIALTEANPSKAALGLLALIIGLEIERITVYMTLVQVFGPKPPHKNAVPILFATGFLEAAAWLAWLAIVNAIGGTAGHLIGLVLFSVLTLVVHSVQMAWFAKLPSFYFVPDPKSIIFSIIEAGAGFLLLLLYRDGQHVLGAIAILVCISIEHVMMATKVDDVKEHLRSVGAII